MEDNFSTDQSRGEWFQDDSSILYLCAPYSYYYYIMIYNGIITQLTIKQNQREPRVCFPATRWLHLRGWETVMSEMCCLYPVY